MAIKEADTELAELLSDEECPSPAPSRRPAAWKTAVALSAAGCLGVVGTKHVLAGPVMGIGRGRATSTSGLTSVLGLNGMDDDAVAKCLEKCPFKDGKPRDGKGNGKSWREDCAFQACRVECGNRWDKKAEGTRGVHLTETENLAVKCSIGAYHAKGGGGKGKGSDNGKGGGGKGKDDGKGKDGGKDAKGGGGKGKDDGKGKDKGDIKTKSKGDGKAKCPYEDKGGKTKHQECAFMACYNAVDPPSDSLEVRTYVALGEVCGWDKDGNTAQGAKGKDGKGDGK